MIPTLLGAKNDYDREFFDPVFGLKHVLKKLFLSSFFKYVQKNKSCMMIKSSKFPDSKFVIGCFQKINNRTQSYNFLCYL